MESGADKLNLVSSILFELLSKVCSETATPDESLFHHPPNKKLRLAKSFSNAADFTKTQVPIPNPTPRQQIQESKYVPILTKNISETEISTPKRPKFDVARKLSELKADRDHWKHLCLSSRLQTAEESHARLELQRNLENMEVKLSEQSQFCHQIGYHLAEIVWSLSQSSQAISSHIKDDQIESLMMLIYGTLDNFLPFASSMSPQNDDPASCSRFVSESESRLVVALVGCACNLAGSADGRRFIYVYPIGSDVTKSISNLVLSDLDNLPSLVQEKLHRLALSYLFNLSTNHSALMKVIEQEKAVKKIEHLSKNVLSPYRHLAESIMKRLNSAKILVEGNQKNDQDNEMVEP